MKKLLITGFLPFSQFKENPSALLVKDLPNTIGQFALTKAVLPTSYQSAFLELESIYHEHFDYIIMLGLAAKRKSISLERVAINLNDASIADNDGHFAKNETILSNGETAYFTKLDLHSLIEKLASDGAIGISNSAGTYVCNNLYYRALHLTQDKNTKALFVHIPMVKRNKTSKNGLDYQSVYDLIIQLIQSLP